MTERDAIAVVDLAPLEVIGEVRTGEGPDGMAWVGGP
jgi:hypothetical protein